MAEPSRIVVVGASLAGLSAVRSLRAEGFTGSIAVIGDEVHPPYDRPPLSKGYLASSDTHPDLGSAELEDVEWILGKGVVGLDSAARVLRLSDGSAEHYDGLVAATGTTPRVLPDGDKAGVHTVRTLDDSVALRAAMNSGRPRVVLVGGGFVGAEVASACVDRGLPVTIVERADVPFRRVLGPTVGAELGRLYVDRGVDLRLGRSVRRLLGDDRVTGVELDDGSVVDADIVVQSMGVTPATSWLADSGLDIDDGVVCDETLLAAPGIVAAGDVARWPNRRLGEFRRVEHWEHAITSGEHAARTLLGRAEPYDIVPWVWSDQFGFKLQFVGSSISHDEVVLDSTLATDGKMLALYRRGDRLVAACGIRRNKIVLGLRERIGLPGSWAAALEQIAGRLAA
ncbi:NAD(P)/FAD-dependent oxidoreductase [Curtobacterium sp. VKM Ac-2887]|uniref:NAD(P)/FAD-dependent oxidoreductase n=1 Tax=Curtobacterium sp. VKM Ac-2887 TaxID=2783819 RepID=UPI00188D3488|nr:FAD-dependent oxidoreductase [Curtobacterium sp. VKM Ac-2887]MBF4585683.1 FAD-dependent oxidoreductase [Curtobacterium sp. VKM Ac-2887]